LIKTFDVFFSTKCFIKLTTILNSGKILKLALSLVSSFIGGTPELRLFSSLLKNSIFFLEA
jgi:hypothetical protein